MASGLQTFTIDTASSPWVYSNGLKTTVSGQAQTFQLYMNDLGETANWDGAGAQSVQGVALADGNMLHFSSDKRMVHITTLTNATAKQNAGSLWVSVNDGPEEEVHIATVTVADVDATGANNLTTITFEYPGKPYKWTWANIQNA